MIKSNNILPQGWISLEINEVFEFIGTSSFSRNDLNYEVDEESIYYIHYGDIHATYKNAVLDFNKETRIPVLNKNIKPSAHLLKEGDLIIADASEDYEGVGEALEVYNIKDKKVLAGLHTFALRDKNNITAHGYRAYLFKNPEVKKRLKTIATGSKVYGISKGNLEKFKITIPPLSEQQKIAKILATWDKAILLHQQLIINKKDNKKAIMKKLLTGEVRFKGFSEEWKEVRLGDLGEIKTSSVDKIFVEGEVIVSLVNYMDVYRNKSISKNFSCSKTSVNERELQTFNLLKGDILFTPSSETPNDIGHSCVITEDLNNTVYSYHLVRYRFFNNESMSFVFRAYVFNNQNILNEFAKRSTGSTRFTISKKDFEDIKARIPNSIEEQNMIASSLELLESEISVLENELISFQKQKQGLMQQLLTGKVRVKN